MTNKGLIKKATAVILSVTLAFGSLALLPERISNDCLITASAYDVQWENCTFGIGLTGRTGIETIKINKITFTGDTVEIPSQLEYNGGIYDVTDIADDVLMDDQHIKHLTMPDTVSYIGKNFLKESSVESIVLSNNLECIEYGLCSTCPSLTSVKCDCINADPDDIGTGIFESCDKLYNEKGAICVANWLFRYKGFNELTSLRIADLSIDGTPIDSIGYSAINGSTKITSLDLEGVKNISGYNFTYYKNLEKILNDSSVVYVGSSSFSKTPWLNNAAGSEYIMLGEVLMYYHTDSSVIDFTSGDYSTATNICSNAFADCVNADTLMCRSDQNLNYNCFYINYDQYDHGGSNIDPMPQIPTYKIKTIYLDGKLLKFSPDDPEMDTWIARNYIYLRGTEWLKNNAEAKAKLLLEQLDLPFYGVNNDKIGTLSKTEEFYTMLKIHDYISNYDYDLDHEYSSGIDAFLCGGKVNCSGYAELHDFLMECAGVRSHTVVCHSGSHAWNEIRIGDEWFEGDAGWDEQYSHTYGWFALSSDNVYNKGPSIHTVESTDESWHDTNHIPRIIAERCIGDIDGDDKREDNDAAALWAYLKGETDVINRTAADINFDGVIDVTDGVLLENFLHGKAVDPDNFPTDGLAAGYKVAFVNGKDYDNIQYAFTDRNGDIILPELDIKAPDGKKLSYDIGKVGQKVHISNPYTVINIQWIDKDEPDHSSSGDSSSTPDSSGTPESSSHVSSISEPSSHDDCSRFDKYNQLGDVNGDGTIDIEDAVAIIQHINGLTPLKANEEKRADVSKDKNIDIDDAVMIISYINGNSTF